jgi:hypothetical protein
MAMGAQTIKREFKSVPVDYLRRVVSGFNPDEIGLARAWGELYAACQAAGASPDLLSSIHDIMETIEDTECIS